MTIIERDLKKIRLLDFHCTV
ncbi:hypothetical protein MIMGU_mgv1a0131032mg, partial [Erythranthe guttata]